jgi:hypothetical protein
MEKVRYNGQMVIPMMDNGKMIFIMDMVYLYGRMGVYLKVDLKTIKKMVRVSS